MGLRVGTSTATVRFWIEDNRTRYDVLFGEGELHFGNVENSKVPKNVTLL